MVVFIVRESVKLLGHQLLHFIIAATDLGTIAPYNLDMNSHCFTRIFHKYLINATFSQGRVVVQLSYNYTNLIVRHEYKKPIPKSPSSYMCYESDP